MKPKTLIGVLPLFSDKAVTPVMMKHEMQLTMEDTQFHYQGQTPVLGCDQPLYDIAKQLLQCSYPEALGEDKLVLTLGALHRRHDSWDDW